MMYPEYSKGDVMFDEHHDGRMTKIESRILVSWKIVFQACVRLNGPRTLLIRKGI